MDIIDKALSAYSKAHLPVSVSKSFGAAVRTAEASSTPCLDFIAWGTQVRSRTGQAATEDIKRAMLSVIGLRTLRVRKVSGGYLRRLCASILAQT